MFYVYVLHSKKDNKLYVGYTKDLAQRFEQHKQGAVDSTRDRRPLKLIYYEACCIREGATSREKYLKTYRGRHFLHKRLKSYFTNTL
jgi:putative endonuclease